MVTIRYASRVARKFFFRGCATIDANSTWSNSVTVRLVLTTCGDESSAATLAAALVERGLAACVTRLQSACSVYRWRGRLCEDHEVQLLIKTTAEREAALFEALAALHPYEEPEILSLAVLSGSPGYLQWIEDATTPDTAD